MALTEIALEKIRRDSDLRAKLMLVDGRSEYTIKRWIEANDDLITQHKYVECIKAHTGLTDAEILEPILQ